MRIKRRLGEIVCRQECIALYGHLSADEFWSHLVEQEPDWADSLPPSKPPELHCHWWRWVPAQPGDDYKMWAFPAKAGTSGAFPVTVWDHF